jgi:magnesium/cobalt transport protein CorA
LTIRARLYNARGADRDVDIADLSPEKVDDSKLIWIDVDERSAEALQDLANALDFEAPIVRQLQPDQRRPRIVRQPDRIAVTLVAVERADRNSALERKDLDLVVGRNLVVTVHDGRLAAIADFEEQLRDVRDLGQLDAGAFMTALIDSVLGGYRSEVDAIEREIDKLDQAAMKALNNHDSFLASVVALRSRIAVLRRHLTPNRDAVAPLVRPDFEVHDDIVKPWPGIEERLERTISAVENARDLLVGSFDIYLGRSAQRSNDVMKVLTLVSAIALPAIVLAGVMGMNFRLGFFENTSNFLVVVGSMIAFGLAIVAIARRRRWI